MCERESDDVCERGEERERERERERECVCVCVQWNLTRHWNGLNSDVYVQEQEGSGK